MYLTKLFFNVVSCFANIVEVDSGKKNNLSNKEFFDVACGLDEKLIDKSYNFNKTFKCHSQSNFLDLKEKMSLECKLYDGINYHCTYNRFEHKEGCQSLPELCEIAYLRCLNHTTINIPIESKTTKESINDLKYKDQMEQVHFSTRKNKILHKTTVQNKIITNYSETMSTTTKSIVLSKSEPSLLDTTDNHSTSSVVFVYTKLEEKNHSEFIYDLTIFIMALITIIICFIYGKRKFAKKGNTYELVGLMSKGDVNS